MTLIAIDNIVALDRSLEEIIESETIKPKRIGFCSNRTGRDTWCGRPIMDDDLEWFDTGPRKKICGQCVDYLLRLFIVKTMPEKAPKNPDYAKIRDFVRRPSKQEKVA